MTKGSILEFDEFLKHALPPLGYSWRPYRRRGIRRKIFDRMRKQHFCDLADYLKFLKESSQEQEALKKLLPVTVSRFFRNRKYYEFLKKEIFPDLIKNFARGTPPQGAIKVWSLGAAAGEEAYSIAMIWEYYFSEQFPNIGLEILATDILPSIIERGKKGLYPSSSLRETPGPIRRKFFTPCGEDYQLAASILKWVRWEIRDLRFEDPVSYQHLVFCCYSLFTYYGPELQSRFISQIAKSLLPLGYLVIGRKEKLPSEGVEFFNEVSDNLHAYQRRPY